MKNVFALIVVPLLFSQTVQAKEDIGDMVTRIDRDCVLVSQSTDQDEDFKELECKAFGGFQLKISGSEGRFSPKISHSGFDVTLKDPDAPHDMASNEIKWIYAREYFPSGEGRLTWLGLMYALKVGAEVQHYGVRLEKRMSCVIAISQDSTAVMRAILNPSTPCEHY